MRQTNPSFSISENLQGEWCDTILGRGVEFVADMPNAASYEWFIGSELEPRFGRVLKLNFTSYITDTLQNLNVSNRDFYNPFSVILKVRNRSGQCVDVNDTLLVTERQLVFTRKTLTIGTFVGRVEGETYDRTVIIWQDGEDMNAQSINYSIFSDVIGLTSDTLRQYYFLATFNKLISYQKYKWSENLEAWWIGTDGIRIWDQRVNYAAGSNTKQIELYVERYAHNGQLEQIRFHGEKVE